MKAILALGAGTTNLKAILVGSEGLEPAVKCATELDSNGGVYFVPARQAYGLTP
jgi:glycerol kinase